MRGNTPLMNSWHSFSPNGRWMVFSSKSRSPYTQLFLTHLDEQGNDTPAVMIENSTAANRAVNIPEFVNVAADGFQRIDAPVAEYYRLIDDASEAMNAGRHEQAIPLLEQALAREPGRRGRAQQLRLGARRDGPPRRGRRPVPQGHAAEPRLPGRAQQPRVGPRAERPGGGRHPRVPKGPGPQARLRGGARRARRRPRAERADGRGDPAPAEGRRARARRTPRPAPTSAWRCRSPAGHMEAVPARGGGGRAVERAGPAAPRHARPPRTAQAGRLAEAIDATRRAIDVASRAGDERLVRELQARLSSYESAGARASAESTRPR